MATPTPVQGEQRQDFISRCMANKEMREQYPNLEQRKAVCAVSWAENK